MLWIEGDMERGIEILYLVEVGDACRKLGVVLDIQCHDVEVYGTERDEY
jgi:hypothetical protein